MSGFYDALFSKSDHLDALEMTLRAILVFFFTLVLIRLSGRRSFGIKSPLDMIIVILLGTLLGRTIVGVSPFFPVAAASLAMVVIHRLLGVVIARRRSVAKFVEGDKIVLFENGRFNERNMVRGMVGREEIFRSMREEMQTEDISKVTKIYIEPTGKINIVKKQPD